MEESGKNNPSDDSNRGNENLLENNFEEKSKMNVVGNKTKDPGKAKIGQNEETEYVLDQD